ncbi:hypothetical protein [Roseibium aggregatum]|uniref:Uncharacterized protein n=1 Tax=Roseibium aggregatum TaxID=187304 RepID=A0A926NYD4_9HYPH|nr:hypothetical protein [Roseibium aggregatum]MBD1545988.1 hypothetical protein [Roseibium aggregatum]
MSEAVSLTYYRARWPEEEVPEGQPEWFFYEVDKAGDAVTRMVEVFPGGKITRNSVEIDQPQDGRHFDSLLDSSLDDDFYGEHLQAISREEFEALYAKGVDTPFWFPR